MPMDYKARTEKDKADMDKFSKARFTALATGAAALVAAWAMGDDLPWIYDTSARSVASPTTATKTVSGDLDYRFKVSASSEETPFTTRPFKTTVLMVR